MTLRETFRRAFAVDPPGPAEPTSEQQPAVDWFCKQVAKRRLTTPGLIALEMSRPLNFIGAQALHFFAPGVWALARQQNYEHYTQFSAFLEKRGSVDYIVRRIEHFEALFERQERGGDEKPPADS
jgi:hypothetical protein